MAQSGTGKGSAHNATVVVVENKKTKDEDADE